MLAQVSVHLKHKDWDARVAAARCLGLLAEHFAHPGAPDLAEAARLGAGAAQQLATQAQPAVKAEPGAGGGEEGDEVAGRHMLRFDGFQISQVLEQGTPLLASWGQVRGSVLAGWGLGAWHQLAAAGWPAGACAAWPAALQ